MAKRLTPFEQALKRCPKAKGPYPKGKKRCWWCGKPLEGRRTKWCSDAHMDIAVSNHLFRIGRRRVLIKSGYRCKICGAKKNLEVNHIVPCMGKHNVPDCSHHLDNLEVLCRPHHLEETAKQRASRKT